MLHCGACCRAYHQHCVAPKPSERQRVFYCDACTKRGWHVQPPLFEDEKSSHLHTKPADEPAPKIATKAEEARPNLEARSSIRLDKDRIKFDDADSSSSRSASSKLPDEDTSNSGPGDVIRSLQSLRERVTILERENEAIRLSSRSKNPRKREFNS